MAQTKYIEGTANWDLSTIKEYQASAVADGSVIIEPTEDGRARVLLSTNGRIENWCAKFVAPPKAKESK